jgi:hypothetical protein
MSLVLSPFDYETALRSALIMHLHKFYHAMPNAYLIKSAAIPKIIRFPYVLRIRNYEYAISAQMQVSDINQVMTPASFRYLFHARDFHFQIRDVKVVY